jgi:hypothetical protein
MSEYSILHNTSTQFVKLSTSYFNLTQTTSINTMVHYGHLSRVYFINYNGHGLYFLPFSNIHFSAEKIARVICIFISTIFPINSFSQPLPARQVKPKVWKLIVSFKSKPHNKQLIFCQSSRTRRPPFFGGCLAQQYSQKILAHFQLL